MFFFFSKHERAFDHQILFSQNADKLSSRYIFYTQKKQHSRKIKAAVKGSRYVFRQSYKYFLRSFVARQT